MTKLSLAARIDKLEARNESLRRVIYTVMKAHCDVEESFIRYALSGTSVENDALREIYNRRAELEEHEPRGKEITPLPVAPIDSLRRTLQDIRLLTAGYRDLIGTEKETSQVRAFVQIDRWCERALKETKGEE